MENIIVLKPRDSDSNFALADLLNYFEQIAEFLNVMQNEKIIFTNFAISNAWIDRDKKKLTFLEIGNAVKYE